MKVSVVIPTLLSKQQVEPMIDDIRRYRNNDDMQIFATCMNESAAKNRNYAIDNAKYDLVIMLDDDISAFYSGWVDDLIAPLVDDRELYNIVSIRCINKNGEIAGMLGDANDRKIKTRYQKAIHRHETGYNLVCSAGIAFYKSDGVRFDEKYIAAVWEDTDFCMQYNTKYPQRTIIINNRCQLVHANEMKARNSQTFKHNREYFISKWRIEL